MLSFWPRMISGDIYYVETNIGGKFLFESQVVIGQKTAHTCSIEINIECKDYNNYITEDENIILLRQAIDPEVDYFFDQFP